MNGSRYNIEFISLTKLFRGRLSYPELVEVNYESPILLKKALYQCAKYFQREGYSDWCHYDMSEKDFIGFLFLDHNYAHAIGACIFRLREYENIPKPFNTMHWVWLHPYARNKGILSRYVDFFNKRFGYWYPETPHSKAMQAFTEKHNMVSPIIYFKRI